MTLRMIIAEDYPMLMAIYETTIMIHNPSIRIDRVNKGSDLVAKVKESMREEQQDYFMILTDNVMPDMSGLDAIREIRKINYRIPIVLMSVDDFKKEAHEYGASKFILKEEVRDELPALIDLYSS